MTGCRGRWAAGRCLGPGAPPSLHLADLGLLVSQQVPGEFADLGHAALPDLGGGELAAGAVSCRHHREERQVEPGAASPSEPLQVGFLAAAGLLLGVVRGQSAAGQPLLELSEMDLSLPVDAVGESGQLWSVMRSWARSTIAVVCNRWGTMCCMNHTSMSSLAGGWLASGVAQPATNTAMTTQHPSLRRTIAPWLSPARLLAAPSVISQPLEDVDPARAPLTQITGESQPSLLGCLLCPKS